MAPRPPAPHPDERPAGGDPTSSKHDACPSLRSSSGTDLLVAPNGGDSDGDGDGDGVGGKSKSKSKWKDRRHRRRCRQREAKAAAALSYTHGDGDGAPGSGSAVRHFRTSRRLLRNAVRNRIKQDMLTSSWGCDDCICVSGGNNSYVKQVGGRGGLRIMIECGFDHLMESEAEIKSLVTQLQVSYANCLGLVADAVLARWEEAKNQDTRTSNEENRSTSDSSVDEAGKGRPLAKDRHKAEAMKALAFAAMEGNCSNTNNEEEGIGDCNAVADEAVGLSRRSIKPARLMFTSLKGRVVEAMSRDVGSANWAVRTNELPFDQAAAGIANTHSKSLPVRIIVLSPDALKPLTGAPDRDVMYVVGGLCDYKRNMNATLNCAANANANASRSANNNVAVEARRLPIEETLGSVSVKILTVNQAVEALVRADINGGDWTEALKATLPSRKLR